MLRRAMMPPTMRLCPGVRVHAVAHAYYAERLLSTNASAQPQPPQPPQPPPQPRSLGPWLWSWRCVRYPVYGAGAILFSVFTVLGGLLAIDSFTYHQMAIKEPKHPNFERNVRGGPGNHPIVLRRDDVPKKERLVIVGGGWGAVSLLNKLDPELYDVTVVSPVNYFLFTPLLPSVAVGTVGAGSVIEPLRRILDKRGGHFVQGAAHTVHERKNLDEKTIELTDNASGVLEVEVISGAWDDKSQSRQDAGEKMTMHLPYDKLVIAVGCVSNDHGAKGLENAHRLKTIQDAMELRKNILENFERASVPCLSEEERRRLLSFVICGGGPTGVEVAAEIFDLIKEDIHKYFPENLPHEASVHLLQSNSHILNTYSEKISLFAEERFMKESMDVVTNARVVEITPTEVTYTIKNPLTGEIEKRTQPSGCTVWSAGIKMNPFTELLSKTLPNQGHPHALKVDAQLRVLGTEPGTMYAVGDASTIDRDVQGYVKQNFAKFDLDRDGKLSLAEFAQLVQVLRQKFPITEGQIKHVKRLFTQYDFNQDHVLEADEVTKFVEDITRRMTAYPATAQIAAQEGHFLAKKLNKYGRLQNKGELPQTSAADLDDAISKPFKFHNLGSIAYLGSAAAFDFPLPEPFGTFFGGLLAMYAWRSVYLSELVSFRTRALVLGDFIKRELWGRDVSWL